jgi:RNA polymerase sigma-54 factor
MAITTKLELRQGQSLVMTPLLQQAIKLLQLSHVELQSFIEAELERNPLLERADPDEPAAGGDLGLISAPGMKDEPDRESAAPETDAGEGDEGEFIDLESDASRSEDLDVEPQDAFPDADAAAFAGATGLGQT